MMNKPVVAPASAVALSLATSLVCSATAHAQAYVPCDKKVLTQSTCTTTQGHWVCPVELSKTALGHPAISPFTLDAKGGTSMIVVWRVVDDLNARFRAGDGPEWINLPASEQAAISESWATNDPDGLGFAASVPARYFRIRLSTLPMPSSQEWKYNIKYHDGAGTQVVCDPYINNTGP